MQMSQARIFIQTNGARLKIDGPAIERMLLHSQKRPSMPEAGGVLIGRHLKDCEHIVVDQVTEPVSQDRGWRFGFFRSKRGHQVRLDASWGFSGFKATYLGEWHTHPEENPVPSSTDLQDWKRRLVKDIYEGTKLFFIIVGTQQFRVWEGSRQGLLVTQLEELSRGAEP
jgi:integrative and conjugative element protein (TIGR02256 family)